MMTMGVHEIICLSEKKLVLAHKLRTVQSRMPKYVHLHTSVHLNLKEIHVRK